MTPILLVIAAAAIQPADPLAPLTQPQPVILQPTPQPPPPLPAVVVPTTWRGVFDAIRAGSWTAAQAGIDSLPPSALTPVAKAELYTAKGSPSVDLGRLQSLIAEAPELPSADQLARLAMTRGATTAPLVMQRRPVVSLGSAPRRTRARPVSGEPLADALRSQIDALVKTDSAAEAEAAVSEVRSGLSRGARKRRRLNPFGGAGGPDSPASRP